MVGKASVAIGTLGLINAFACLVVGYWFGSSIYSGPAVVGGFLILDGAIMLGGAVLLFASHYFIGSCLQLAPSLFVGYVAWVEVLRDVFHAPDEPLWDEAVWVSAFVLPVLISAAGFAMHYYRWRKSHRSARYKEVRSFLKFRRNVQIISRKLLLNA